MLLEQSIHHLDLLRYVYGTEAETVACVTWNPPGSHYRGDACAAALIQFTGGLMAIYHGTWVSGSDTLAFQWRTDFERGVVIQRDLFGDLAEGTISDSTYSQSRCRPSSRLRTTPRPCWKISLRPGGPTVRLPAAVTTTSGRSL